MKNKKQTTEGKKDDLLVSLQKKYGRVIHYESGDATMIYRLLEEKIK